MLIIGLTGSIGMGKSTTADMFRAEGVPVHDSDAAVHALYRSVAVLPIKQIFPDTVVDGVIDRSKLGAEVIGNAERMKALEAIIHPLVERDRRNFLMRSAKMGRRYVVVDIPLLYEIGGETDVDLVVVCSAPEHIQESRVLARPNMTREKFLAIRARQTPDSEKRLRAHFVVDTGSGLYAAQRQIHLFLRSLSGA